MPWFRIDDGFWSHPKTLRLSDGAQALWMRAGSWSMHHLTDGHVPDYALTILSSKPRFVAELMTVSLWFRVEDGYRFHDWEKYQPTREQVEAERHAAAERKRKSRETSRRDTRRDSDRSSPGGSDSPSHPIPTHPSNKTNTSSPVPEREGYPQGTDEGESLEVLCARQASSMGVDYGKVRAEIGRACGRFPNPTGVMRIIATVLERAKPPIKSPTGVVLTAVRNDWAEWQQFLDEEAA